MRVLGLHVQLPHATLGELLTIVIGVTSKSGAVLTANLVRETLGQRMGNFGSDRNATKGGTGFNRGRDGSSPGALLRFGILD